MPKLVDIAKLAGTSIATVSKVLNNYTGVNEKTRERVLEAVKTLGYVPNASARQLTLKKSYMVGVVFTESLDIGLEHPFYGGVIEGFRKHISELGYDVTFISSKQSGQQMSYLDHYRYRNLDGVFVCTYAGDDTDLKDLFESEVPCITTDVVYQNVPLVVSDNIDGAFKAYEYLRGLGHEDIVHIHGPIDTLAGRERLEGFKQGLAHFGLTLKPGYLIQAGNFDFDSGYHAVKELIEARQGKLPDALIAASDIVALGAVKALRDAGFDVPADCSVIGFDNIAMSEYSEPRLTTMAQDRLKIGSLVAELLLGLIEGKRIQKRTMVPMKLLERDTCMAKGTADKM